MTTSSDLISTDAILNAPTRSEHGAEPSIEAFLADDGPLRWQDSLERWLLHGGDETPASLETVIESLELGGLELSSLDVLMDEPERHPDSARSPLLALAHMQAVAQRGRDGSGIEPARHVRPPPERPSPSVVPVARASAGSDRERGSTSAGWRAGRWITLGYVVAVAAIAAGGALIAGQDRAAAEPTARLQSASPRWQQLSATLRSAPERTPKPDRGSAEQQAAAPTEGESPTQATEEGGDGSGLRFPAEL